MLRRLLDRLPLRVRVITNDDGDPYLGRVYLLRVFRSVLPGVFLHRFFRSDGDRELHNHPWKWAVSLVLAGGYREERLDDKYGSPVTVRVLGPGRLNFIRGSTFHRIELLDEERGAWSLFIAGPRPPAGTTWGFLDTQTGRFETYLERDARIGSTE
jgi:hypothetical protein